MKMERDLLKCTGEYDKSPATGLHMVSENETWFSIPYEQFNALPGEDRKYMWNNMKFVRRNKKEKK